MYCEVEGKGRPLCLIHGLGNDMRSWERAAHHLCDSFQLIKIDLRGSGRTDKPKGPYMIEGMASDVARAMDALGCARANVAGFSMGGCVAICLALEHPEKIEGLALISTTPAWSRPHPFTKHAQHIFGQTEISEQLLRDVYELTYGDAHKRKFTAETYINYRMNDPYPQTIEAYLCQLDALKNFDRADEIPKINSPTLIVAGLADKVIPPETSSWLGKKIKGSSLHLFEDAGHMVIEEEPKRLADLLKTWGL